MSSTSSTTSTWYDSPYPTGLPAGPVVTNPPAVDEAPPPRARFAPLTPGDEQPTPRFARPAFAALVLGSALLYLVGLGASGNANSFYAAAVQAGTLDWKAFFFGSLDAGNAITVDKPPMSLWPMEIAGRLFGFNTWSMLVPQALMGVAAVALLTLTVKRWSGWTAGLIAGLVLALTPVAVLMFRFNNPDALMTLLLVVGAWALTRALESGQLRWMLVLGVSFGFGFLTKGLQPFTVVPAFALAFLLFAPMSWGRRIGQLLLGGVAIVVSAGWWVVAVLLTPAADRPYIGGSTNNNPLELAFGYNGLGRLTGNEGGGGAPGGGGGGGANFSGSTGLGRLFNSEMGGQISWLLPAALVATVALLAVGIVARRAGTDTRRLLAATVMWGGWLVVTGAVLSFASGTIHAYYTVQLAPAIAALVGVGVVVAWRLRHEVGARVLIAATTLVTAFWAFALLGRSADYWPALRWLVVVAGVVTAVAVLAGPVMGSARRRPAAIVAAVAIAVTGLGAPAAYAATTASTPQQGSTPAAGPAVTGAVLSFASGTIHAYYTVQLAPAIAALVGLGVVVAWRLRHEVGARVVIAATTLVTAFWAFALLGRSADYWPALRWLVVVAGVVTAVAVLAGPVMGTALRRPAAIVAAVAIAVTGLGAPAAYAATTASTHQQGSTPAPGPAVTGGTGGFGGRGGAGGFPGGGFPGGGSGTSGGTGGFPGGGTGGFPGGTAGSGTGSGSGTSGGAGGLPGGSTGNGAPSTGTAPSAGGARSGGPGGGESADADVVALLEKSSGFRWAAASVGSQTAASLELASGGVPVMAIGGFTGSDPSPTLAQFQAYVAAGDIHYFVAGGGMGGGRGGGEGTSSQITSWVEANFTATTVGSSTVYELTKAAS